MSRYLAIDVDPQGLFVVAGSARGGAARVDHALAWAPGEEHGPPPLTPETAKAIGEQLRERLKAAGISPAPVLVAVGRDRVILKELRHPVVPPADEPAMIRFQAMKELTESPDEVVLDYAPLANGVPDPGAERRSMAVVVRRDVFAAIRDMCAAAGLKLAAVTPRPFAVTAGLTRAFASGAALPPDDPAGAVAVLTLGLQGGEFTVARAGQVVFSRSVPAPVLVNEAILLGEVRRNLTVYAGQYPAHPVRAVYVAESEEALGGWAARLRAGLSVPVHAFDPLAGSAVSVSDNLRGRFAGAAGLLAGKTADSLPINFAAPRQPRAEADPRRTKVLVGALAALLLAGAAVAGAYFVLDSADRDLGQLRKQKADLEKVLADQEPDGKRLEAVDQWASREVNYLDELYDMTDRFPPGDPVRVVRLNATPGPVNAKTGKQEFQARFEWYLGAKNPDAVTRLVTEMEKDNTGKDKFYVGTQKRPTGLVPGNVAHNQAFTLTTQVNRRPPAAYTRLAVFPTPYRQVANPAPEVAAADPAAEPPADEIGDGP